MKTQSWFWSEEYCGVAHRVIKDGRRTIYQFTITDGGRMAIATFFDLNRKQSQAVKEKVFRGKHRVKNAKRWLNQIANMLEREPQ